MKITNIITLIGTIIIALASTAFAGEHPATLPQIRSQDSLRNYALSIAKHGGRYVYSPSMDWSYTNTVRYTETNAAYGEQLFDRLFSVPFNYRVLNSQDQVSSYAYAYDTNWTLLFFGYGSAIANDLSQTNGIHTGIWMQDIPILSDVSSAQVLIFDEKGQTTETRELQVNQYGQVMWQSWMSGYYNVMLSVTYTDGVVLTYNVTKPVANTPDVIYGSDRYSIDGHYTIESSAKNVTLKIMETWTLPSAFLDFAVDQRVTIDVLGLIQEGKAYFERPISVEVTDMQTDEVSTIVMNATEPTRVLFPSGKYRLKFNWSKFGQPQFLYTGGGIGKG
jgi:hypothetical protein